MSSPFNGDTTLAYMEKKRVIIGAEFSGNYDQMFHPE